MLPLGRCLLLWRLEKGLSQAALAAKAGLPQPNLSDIERGERDVSLRTLRALALALGIRPGTLADGEGPTPREAKGLSREALERVARAVAEGREPSDPSERAAARDLVLLLGPHLGSKGLAGRSRPRGGLSAQRAWLALAGAYSKEEIESLRKRVLEKADGRRDKRQRPFSWDERRWEQRQAKTREQ